MWRRTDEDADAETGSSRTHQVLEQRSVRRRWEEEAGRRRHSTGFVQKTQHLLIRYSEIILVLRISHAIKIRSAGVTNCQTCFRRQIIIIHDFSDIYYRVFRCRYASVCLNNVLYRGQFLSGVTKGRGGPSAGDILQRTLEKRRWKAEIVPGGWEWWVGLTKKVVSFLEEKISGDTISCPPGETNLNDASAVSSN